MRAGLWMLPLLLLTACSHSPPNVVVILVDDLGWKDTGVYGSAFYETPRIDRLAAEGLRFTQFYSAGSVCSPTRASIMTGRHPARVRITNWIGGSQNGMLRQAEYLRALPLEEITLGEAFQRVGYATGYLGKWHLGGEGFRAVNQGFETVIASNDAGQPGSFFAPYVNPNFTVSNVPDLESDSDSTYLTDRLADLAVEFIRDKGRDPFLLMLSFYTVHTPIQSKPEQAARFKRDEQVTEHDAEAFGGMTRLTQDHAAYAGMIASLDENVGRILDTLDELGLTSNTIIVFTSDNGGLSTLSNGRTWAPTSNAPLRAGKGWLYEGGIRIPLIIRAPEVEPGLSHMPGTTDDLLPTLLSLASQEPLDDLDGQGLLASRSSDRALYWHFPHYHGSANRPSGAIRSGRYKLIEWFEDGSSELYDLESDPGERNDISEFEPGLAQDLLTRLQAWRLNVQAAMPTPNPDYSPPGGT